jgi:hypothetical protein
MCSTPSENRMIRHGKDDFPLIQNKKRYIEPSVWLSYTEKGQKFYDFTQ